MEFHLNLINDKQSHIILACAGKVENGNHLSFSIEFVENYFQLL